MDLKFWEQKPIPTALPPDLAAIVSQVKASPDQMKALMAAHRLLTQRCKGRRGQTYYSLHRLFRRSEEVLESGPGFYHCTHMNYLLIAVLVKSDWFTVDDIRLRWTVVFGFSPHQYAEVKVGAHWVDVDLWGASYGIPLGDHSHWFHAGRLW